MLPLKTFDKDKFVFMATKFGTVKKVSLEHFSRPRASGIIALDLDEGDELVGAGLTTGGCDVMLFSDVGKVVRFNEEKVRAMGRTARGVRGIKLADDQTVISLVVAGSEQRIDILTATENGFGKRTALDEYRVSGRGGQGVISIQVNERNGKVVRAVSVSPSDEIMLISNRGTLVRIKACDISVIGRNTQGVRLINLNDGEHLVGLERIDEAVIDSDDEEADESPAENTSDASA